MSKYSIYFAYMGIMLIWNILIFAAPLLASEGSSASSAIYAGFSPFCHQEASRSLCLISDSSGSQSMGDCIITGPTTIINRYTSTDARGTAYEFGVCARDVAIYMAMLLGGLCYPFVQKKIDENNTPPLWLFVLALVPIAIDGGTQYMGLRESTNTLRLITGAIAGFAVPFFLIPLLYYFVPVMKRALFGKQ
ncbi:MAG: DUF2085 domain-containing protein [Candidatus Micrarchaeia archaeon]|jgi:uncharacterized membrane protein